MLPAASSYVDYASPALVLLSLGRDFLDLDSSWVVKPVVVGAPRIDSRSRRADKSEARAAPEVREDSFRECYRLL